MGSDRLTRGQRWDLYLGGVVRRYLLVMISIGLIGLAIGGLNTLLPLLGWIVAAAALIGSVVFLVQRTRRPAASGER